MDRLRSIAVRVLTVDDGPGTDLTVNGTLSFNGTGKIAGAGSVSINSGGTLGHQRPRGDNQFGRQRQYSEHRHAHLQVTGANYPPNAGMANQAAGSGLPATVNNLAINNYGQYDRSARTDVAVNGDPHTDSGSIQRQRE